MTYSLICEGACNPARQSIDAAVDTERRGYRGDRFEGVPPISPELAERLRALTHTEHQRLSPTRALCLACGATRVYGSVG